MVLTVSKICIDLFIPFVYVRYLEEVCQGSLRNLNKASYNYNLHYASFGGACQCKVNS
jgi:hypothetical protein